MEPVALALRGSRPMIDSAVIDLPEPDSPTIPSTCPASTANDTPRTASTTPSSVGMRTVRSVTSSTAARGDRPPLTSEGATVELTLDGRLAMRSACHSYGVVVHVVHGLAVRVAGDPRRHEVEAGGHQQRRPRC